MILLFKVLRVFVNELIKKGKKNKALKILKNLIIELNKKFLSWKNLINTCLLKVRPFLIVKRIQRKHSSFYKPNITSFEKELKIAAKWLINGTRERNDKKNFHYKLVDEMSEIMKNNSLKSKTLIKKSQYDNILVNTRIPYGVRLVKKKKKKW